MATQEEKKIVLERLKRMPPTLKLSIGSYGSFSRAQIIEQIENDTEIGELFVSMHMKYLRSFKEEIVND